MVLKERLVILRTCLNVTNDNELISETKIFISIFKANQSILTVCFYL
jgi:hypothetical protein